MIYLDLPDLNDSFVLNESRSFVLDYSRNNLKNNGVIELRDLMLANPCSSGFGSKDYTYKSTICNSASANLGCCHVKTDAKGDDRVNAYMAIYLCNDDLYELVICSDAALRADFYLNGEHLGYVRGLAKKDGNKSVPFLDKIAYWFGQNNKSLQRTRYFDIYDHYDAILGDVDIYGHGFRITDKIYLRTNSNESIPILVNHTYNTFTSENRSFIISREGTSGISDEFMPFFFALSLFFRGYIVTNESESSD